MLYNMGTSDLVSFLRKLYNLSHTAVEVPTNRFVRLTVLTQGQLKWVQVPL